MQDKEILYVDLDGVLCDYAKLYKAKRKINPLQQFPQSQYGFFSELEEIKDAVKTVKKLSTYYDVWFLTAPSWKNPMCLAEKNYWIKNHFGFHWAEKLIIGSDKSKCMGSFLIDDHHEGRGQDKFVGELILFGSDTFPDWNTVEDYLMGHYVKNQNNEL